jgi:ketosteroid isomerase-like protein
MERFKKEILDTEKAFAQLVKEEGLKAGFLAYAADEAVLSRGGQLIKGKKAIEAYFDRQTLKDVRLEWAPDFVSVSASGDLGYTYGRFTLQAMDQAGQEIKSEGIFHTVWKREPNGEWRYVWD